MSNECKFLVVVKGTHVLIQAAHSCRETSENYQKNEYFHESCLDSIHVIPVNAPELRSMDHVMVKMNCHYRR